MDIKHDRDSRGEVDEEVDKEENALRLLANKNKMRLRLTIGVLLLLTGESVSLILIRAVARRGAMCNCVYKIVN